MNEKIYSQTELRQMVSPLLKKYRASYALLFGSYARGEATGAYAEEEATAAAVERLVARPDWRLADRPAS